MDPALDPPPLSAQPAGAPAPFPAAVNPIPAHSLPINHPPYAEMITAAIVALNERDGSSKRAIAKYIETHYPALPPTHSDELTQQLQLLKTNGQLVMVKKSYALPSRSTAAAVNGDVNAVAADPGASGSKRRGRPPKPKPDAGQAAVPVFAAPINMNAEPAVASGAHIAAGPASSPARARGRPPKRGPPQSSGSVGKPRGRPKKNAAVAPAHAPPEPATGSGRPRGRPPKPINAVPVGGGLPAVQVPVGGVSVGGKRRGRPAKAGGGVAKKARKLRQFSGKPLGRPKKSAVVAVPLANDTPDRKLVDSYINLNNELDALKTKVKDTVNVVRPFLNNADAITAVNELEAMAQSATAPSGTPVPPQPQQPQPQM